MSGRKRFFFLLGILTMVAVGAGTITLKVLYDAAFEEERERLVESAESQARLIEAVARFDQLYSQDDVPGGSFEATLSQLREAHSQFKGFGETGEFVLAKLEGDSIIFLLSHRHHDLEKPHPVSFTGDEAEPMRRALSGKCGTVVGLDYRGEMVLAAHEPVAVLNLGIVAKIDIAEIRAPFIRAGILASCVAGVLVLLGAILFVRVGMPLVHRLEESEKKYRQLFSAESDAILVFDAATLKFIEVNQAAIDLYGYSLEEFLSLEVQDISAEPEKTLAAATRARNGDIDKLIHRDHKKKDGTLFPTEISQGSFTLGNRRVACVIIRDITERKLVEEALQRSEEKHRILVEQMNEGLGAIDADGRINFANDSLCKILGRPSEDLIGLTLKDLVDDLNRHVVDEQMLALREDKVSQGEIQWSKPDGRQVPTMVSARALSSTDGTFQGAIVVVTDISARIESELALRESEAKYRAIIDFALDAIVLIDSETGRLVQFNTEAYEFLGYSRDEFQKLTIADIDATESPEEVAEHIETVLRDGSDKFETQMRTKTGELKDVLVSVTSIWLQGRQYLSSMWRDVTIQKQAEKMRRQQHEFLQTVIDSLGHPLSVISTADYTIKLANAACKSLEEYEDGITCHRLFHGSRVPCDGITQPCPLSQVIATGQPVTVEHQHRDQQGKPKYSEVSAFPIFDSEGNVSEIIEYSVDITERKLAEGALRKSEERIRSMIDQAGDALYLMNTDGRFIEVNQRACEVLGYTRDELLKLEVPDINPLFPRDKAIECIQSLQLGKPMTIEAIHQRRDGTTFPVEIRVGLIEVRGTVRVLSLARDISERKAAEATLNASLKEKETLLKEIHHRVKNNLQVISSLLRIQSDHTEDQEVISVLKASQSRVNSMALIHEQLYRSSNLAEIDFAEYVQNLAEQMLASYGVNTERITVENSLRDVFLSIDTAIPCGLIVTELLSNALKHAFPDGRTGQIRISHRSDGNQCTLTVSDTGVGIPSNVDPEHSDSLGLQLVGLLAKQLGGSIEMKSDKGVSFRLVYPQETTSAGDSSGREIALENA